MELVGYNAEEEQEIYRIEAIQDSEQRKTAMEAFAARTGKEFPETEDWSPNIDTMLASAAVSGREVERWANKGYPGGYKPRRRPF